MFKEAMQSLRSKPGSHDAPWLPSNTGDRFVNRMPFPQCDGMATVYTTDQVIGGPESTATKPVVLKHYDKDHPAAYDRERRILQYLSRRERGATEFAIQMLEAQTMPGYNEIVMERGGANLAVLVRKSSTLSPSARTTQLALWGQQACEVGAMVLTGCEVISPCRVEIIKGGSTVCCLVR